MSASNDVTLLLDAAEDMAQRTGQPRAKIEIEIVGLVSMFEARLQHHFARGPFYQKLSERFRTEGHTDLAQNLYAYYLAVNVIKRGAGKSLRELHDTANLPFTVDHDNTVTPIDVTADSFFGGLVGTLKQAHQALDA